MHRIIVFALLILGIIFSVYLVSQRVGFFSKASPDIFPKNVTFSNISDNGFTVSWVTDKPTIGFVKYSQDSSFNQTEDDERDKNDPKPRTTHFVVLKNLQPEKSYFLKIGEQSFQQTTAPVAEDTPPVPVLSYGKLKKQNGEIPQEVIVYLKLPYSTTLSTYTKDDGNWLITVTNARTADLSSHINVKNGDMAEVWLDDGIERGTKNKKIKISSSEELNDLILDEPLDKPVYDANVGIGSKTSDSTTWIQKILEWFKKIFNYSDHP